MTLQDEETETETETGTGTGTKTPTGVRIKDAIEIIPTQITPNRDDLSPDCISFKVKGAKKTWAEKHATICFAGESNIKSSFTHVNMRLFDDAIKFDEILKLFVE